MKRDIKIVSNGIQKTEVFINDEKMDSSLMTGVRFEHHAGCIPMLQIDYLSNPEGGERAPIMYPQWYVDELAKELKEALQFIEDREETIRDKDNRIETLQGMQKANVERILELEKILVA